MGRARRLGMCYLDLAFVVVLKGAPEAKQIPLSGSAGMSQPPRLTTAFDHSR